MIVFLIEIISSLVLQLIEANNIKNNSPLIVPIKLLGFNDVFQRNGLKILNRKKIFSMEICKPIRKNIHENSIDEITSELEKTIN